MALSTGIPNESRRRPRPTELQLPASQATLNIILQTLQSQASTPASTAQPSQPQAQSQPQGQPQAPIQSQHQPQAQAQSTAPPQHLMINKPSELDRWCQELGM
ncbi:hypothetical protein DY000_02015705 [Brassica cretica]|uniref:Uncharacterized protein n=1 Tax=Brassica cretica TaxID=69181 RepID=A0ABQ7CNT9_BRACR|nr:hypothetical protein DY000_02015705 [Brassica cretica]